MNAKDWSGRYYSDNTKWDLKKSPPPLEPFASGLPKGSKILIPGCGHGYEIQDFAQLGHSVTAVDFSQGAIDAARKAIGDYADTIRCDDFFACSLEPESFDVCYERAFLCAIPMNLWDHYGPRVASLLKDSGLLAGVFHYGVPEDDGPPSPMNSDDRARILEPHFTLIHDEPCPSGLGVFSEHDERWQVWKKKSAR